MKFDVISIGSAVLDVFIKSPDLKILKTDAVFTGTAIIAPYGAKAEVDQLVITSGGGGTNTAVGFSRLGLKASVLARCGWDFAGRLVREDLKKEKVDDSLLIQLEGEDTDYTTALVGPDGGRTLLVYRGGTRLEENLIDFSRLKTKWFYISSLEGNTALLKKLVNFAKKNKIKVALNPGRREMGKKEKLLPILKNVDVLIVNREEAGKLTGISMIEHEIFPKMCSLSGGIVVITEGRKGAHVCLPSEASAKLGVPKKGQLVIDGFKVEVVEATGAGDGFGCGFVTGLIKGWKLEDALKLGVANGAAAVTEIGAKKGLLREKEIDEWMAKKLATRWEKD